MPSLIVTGANGFVGSALCVSAHYAGWDVKALTRRECSYPQGVQNVVIDDFQNIANLGQVFHEGDVVVHLAARVHVMQDKEADPLAAFRQVNVEQTMHLAKAAAKAGVKRFIYLSSIKVNGEFTQAGKPFCADDPAAPQDPYGISKMEAEQALLDLSRKTSMQVVIIRPPLVYGPNVKANFLSMLGVVKRGLPLPLGSVNNLRSMVALDNLTNLILVCATHPAAAGETFLVSDDEDVSVSGLLVKLSQAMGKRSTLVAVPLWVLQFGAILLGKQDMFLRLTGSLQVDIEKTKQVLQWRPPLSLDAGLKKTVDWYLNLQRDQRP